MGICRLEQKPRGQVQWQSIRIPRYLSPWLQKNPEYVEKIKACAGDMDAMMAVFKEYTGMDINWWELKQFGLRQLGLV